MSAFFLIASLILFVMQVVIGLWFYFVFPTLGWKIPVVILPLLMTAFIRFTMAYTRTHYGTLESIAYYISYIWAGLVFIFFCFIVGFALLQFICAVLRIPAKPVLGPLSIIVLLSVTILSIGSGFAAPKMKHIHVNIPGAPTLKAAILSDAHLGTGVSLARWQQVLQRIKTEKPDIILVLGDLFEYGMHRKQYAQALAQLATPYGSYGVLGNHEYYMGLQNSIDFYKQAGITLLQNQVITLPNGVQLIGINDIQTAGISAVQLDKLLTQTDEKAPRILLSHQPLLTQVAADHQVPLMLSGHTHAGQIWPFHYLVKMKYPYIYGIYPIGPESKLYVTSGIFYWGMPLRLFAPAEIPLIHIN